jgi:hypothetical protein
MDAMVGSIGCRDGQGAGFVDRILLQSAYSVGEKPLDQGQVPMAYQDATCDRLIPRLNPFSPHSEEMFDEI